MKPIKFALTNLIVLSLLILNLTACQQETLPAQWHWQRVDDNLPRQAIVLTVAADPTDPNRLWAGYYASGGLATSPDGGQSWIFGAEGLVDNPIFDLLPLETPMSVTVWAATRDGLLHSQDRGDTWHPTPDGLPNVTVFALAADEKGQLYVGLDNAGIFKLTLQGWQSISKMDDRLDSAAVLSLAVSDDGQQLYAGTSGRGVFASRDGGQTWVNTYPDQYAPDVALNPTNPAIAIASLRDRLVRTVDGGQSWHTIPLTPAYNEFVSLLWLADGSLGVGTSQGLLYRSQDNGDTWVQGGDGLPPGGILALNVTTQQPARLLIGTWTGVYASDDGGQTVQYLSPPLGTPRPQTLLATDDSVLLGTWRGLFRWQPSEKEWLRIASDLPAGVASLAVNSNDSGILYAGTMGQGVYRSGDGGESWQFANSLQKTIPAVAVAPTRPDNIYMLAAWERVYASPDGGQSWQARWDGLGDVVETTSLAVDPTEPTVYVGTEIGLYRSDNDSTWYVISKNLRGQSVLALLVQANPYLRGGGTIIYIGTTRGVYRSLDKGRSVRDTGVWGLGLENRSVTTFLATPLDQLHLLAGTAYAGVYESWDGGYQWQPIGPLNLEGEVVESMAWGPEGALFIATTNQVWQGKRE